MDEESKDTQQLVERPYFKLTLASNDQYELETNMGQYWQWHVLKLAAKIKNDI